MLCQRAEALNKLHKIDHTQQNLNKLTAFIEINITFCRALQLHNIADDKKVILKF